ncbi:MAG: hypothetical protein CSB49_03595 [Proteobacteria bacterium]|nr:MAG: hypothetical protein CSB49_03595 [Pseudomonadota bacterium]
MSMSGTHERKRRGATRVRLCEPVRLRGEGRLTHSRALAINLSSTGLFVAADEPVEVGERVRCELSFLPKSPIDVACRVVWVRDDTCVSPDQREGLSFPSSRKERLKGMGLMFEDLTPTKAERIEHALSRLQRDTTDPFPTVDLFAESGTWAPADLLTEKTTPYPSVTNDPRSLKLALVLSLLVIAGLLATIALLLAR